MRCYRVIRQHARQAGWVEWCLVLAQLCVVAVGAGIVCVALSPRARHHFRVLKVGWYSPSALPPELFGSPRSDACRASTAGLPRVAYVARARHVDLTADLLTAILTSAAHGWQLTPKAEDATLIWLRRRSKKARGSIGHNPARQLINVLPSAAPMLTNKAGLYTHVHAYEVQHRLNDTHLPEQYLLFGSASYRALRTNSWMREGTVWVLKDPAQAVGRGITVIPNVSRWLHSTQFEAAARAGKVRIMQRFIEDPLLLDGRKSEVRLYFVVLSLDPLLVVGYYDIEVRMQHAAVVKQYWGRVRGNQSGEMRTGGWGSSKASDWTWTHDRWVEHCVTALGHSRARIGGALRRVREALVRDLNATKRALKASVRGEARGQALGGHFEMFGADFIPTRELQFYHTEVQRGHAMQPMPEKARVIAPAVGGAAGLAAEVMQRRRRGLPLRTLDCLNGSGYGWLINEARSPGYYFSAAKCAGAGMGGNTLCRDPVPLP